MRRWWSVPWPRTAGRRTQCRRRSMTACSPPPRPRRRGKGDMACPVERMKTSTIVLELVALTLGGEPREQLMFSDDENDHRSNTYHSRVERLKAELDRRIPTHPTERK